MWLAGIAGHAFVHWKEAMAEMITRCLHSKAPWYELWPGLIDCFRRAGFTGHSRLSVRDLHMDGDAQFISALL